MIYPYVFAWKNNAKRATLYGRRLRVLARGALNSALVEFENGQREIVSRNALRRGTGSGLNTGLHIRRFPIIRPGKGHRPIIATQQL